MDDTTLLEAHKRDALLTKIAALLSKTEARGCTEAEAIAAAELASRLMSKYGLSLSELESISSPVDACETDGTPIGNVRAHEVLHVSWAIAHYTDTRCWYQRHGIISLTKDKRRIHPHHGVLLIYFGLSADVQVAIYLTNTLRNAMDTEWANYWNAARDDSQVSARTARANFMRGMANRLSQRLREMKNSRSAVNDCRAIVLAKDQIVTSAFEATGIKLGSASRSRRLADHNSYLAGSVAANRITIARAALQMAKVEKRSLKPNGQHDFGE